MTDEEISLNLQRSRSVFLEASKVLSALGVSLPQIAAGAASIGAQIIGSMVPDEQIDEAIQAMTVPMKKDAHEARAAVDAEHVKTAPSEGQLHWMSFANDNGFLGVAIVRGKTIAEALRTTHALGINPGGTVMAGAIPAEIEPAIPVSDVNRLLSEAESTVLKGALEAFAERTVN